MVKTTNEQRAKIQTILQQLDLAQSGKAPDNRRRATRMNLRIPLRVVILAGIAPAPVDIFTRNLSVSGMGFVSRRAFKINERMAIKLYVNGLPPRLILARVTFGRYVTAGLYEMGAEFLESMKDQSQLQIPNRWLASIPPTAKVSVARSA